MSNSNIINELYELVENACKQETNMFGYGAWEYHIISVIKYSKILANRLNADLEIVEIAALLHDYSGIKSPDGYEEHHIKGSIYAEDILKTYNYPQERIEKIKHCIIAHRGSKDIPRETIEAEIIASADAMAHFDNIHSLLYLAFVNHKMDINEGTIWVLNKLERSYKKLMPEAKEIINEKYKAIQKALITNL